MVARVGVLALQGDVEPHARMLRGLGEAPIEVRRPKDLAELSHLVLPGGESTTHEKLLRRFELWNPIVARARAGRLRLFGTCAGAILLARMELLDVDVERNAYGTQLDSFERELNGSPGFAERLRGVFIRAPRFTRVGSRVRVLATADGDPMLVEADGVLAATFHPELTDETFVHERFVRG